MKSSSAKILMALICVARGTSFLFSKHLLNQLSPTAILAVRFILAFIVLSIIFNKKIRECKMDSIKGGLILGVLYTVCMLFEMYGLRTVDTGVSSLIENMAIVIVPLYVAVLTRTMPKSKTMLCAVLAVIGVGFLSVTQGIDKFNLDLMFIILAALTYGACIIATHKVSRKGDPVTIGMIQLGTMGILSLIISLITGDFAMPNDSNQWVMLLFLVLICSCFGFTFQPVAQKYLAAETASLFSVINPLSACIMGVIFAGEGFGLLKAIGCVLIFVAMIIYNLDPSSTETESI